MTDLTYIYNGQIVLETGIIWDGAMVIADGIIQAVGKERELPCPAGATKIDAKGAYVGPGFVDIHVHAGNDLDDYVHPEETAEFFLNYGHTAFFPTPSYSQNFKEIMDGIACVKAAMPKVPTIKGIYMEGPFTNPDHGANRDINPWRHEITPQEYEAMADLGGTDIKVWTIAPERTDLLPFMAYARKVNPDVVFALGHSEATPMQVRGLGKYRPTLMTHTFDATGRQPVLIGTRGYGPDEYALQTPEMYCELISDSCGIHVHPEMQRLLLQSKGVDKVVLITDCTVAVGENPPALAHITDLNFDHNSNLCGSRLTLDQACKNIMAATNCGIAQAFLMAATNPAKVVGMYDEIGSIAPGKAADLVFVTDRFQVQRVLVAGKTVR